METFKQNEGVGCNKFFVMVEVHRWEGTKVEEFSVLVPRGNPPSIGDYTQMFEEALKIPFKLDDIIPRAKGSNVLSFKPINPEPRGIQKVIVTRYVQDFTYRPVVRL